MSRRTILAEAAIESARRLGCTCAVDVVVSFHPGGLVELEVVHDGWCALDAAPPPSILLVNPERLP